MSLLRPLGTISSSEGLSGRRKARRSVSRATRFCVRYSIVYAMISTQMIYILTNDLYNLVGVPLELNTALCGGFFFAALRCRLCAPSLS